MEIIPPSSDTRGIRVGDVGGDVNFSALGDIVGGDKITTITTTIQISVEAVTQRPLITTSPYRGLDRFEDRDKDLFFGRDQLIKSLLGQLSASNLLLVLGASGSGKSSVVRAGLLPQLSQLIGTRFRYFTFVPDVNPFESLRSSLQAAGFSQAQTRELTEARPETPAELIPALQRADEQWLFFVDQFEEIFTVGDEKLRATFIAALTQIAQDRNSSTKLVLAMRADFLDRFSPFPQFAKIIEKNIDIVADMHADELRQAIEQPAARHGVVFEQGLVEEIIKDVQGQAGSLPLLQYTLDLFWHEEARENGLADRHLNATTYRALGGVRGALQKRADEIYASFGDSGDRKAPTAKQEIVRQIFLRLVDLAGEGSNDAAWRPVRRRASMTMFTASGEREILQSLINQKLLVGNREGDDATVEVAHEALFTSWGQLKKWIEGGKQVIFARNRLADDARRWQLRKEKQDPGADEELLGGSRLSQAIDMRARGDFVTVIGGLSPTETQFLDASITFRERRAAEEQTRQKRDLEAAQRLAEARSLAAGRLRKGLAIAVVLALFAISGGGLAWFQSREAAKQERTARDEAAKATRLLSQTDFLRATDLLAEKKTFEALAFLARACRTDPKNAPAASRLFSLLVQRNWVIPLSDPLGKPRGGSNPASLEHVRFSPDGTNFVTTTFYDAKATVWETATGRVLLGPFPANTGGFDYGSRPPLPDERSFSSPDPWILIPHEKEVQIGDLASGKVRDPILKNDQTVTVAQFSPDGASIQTGDESGQIVTWEARTGTKSSAVRLAGSVLALSREGTRAVTRASKGIEPNAEGDGFQIWDLAGSGKPKLLASKLNRRFVVMRDDGEEVCSWYSRKNELTEIYFLDVPTGAERTAKLENAPPDPEYIERASALGSRFVVTAAIRRFESDLSGQRSFGAGQVRVWDPVAGTPLCRISHQTTAQNPAEGLQPYRACLSADESRVASLAFEDPSLRISSVRDGLPLNEPPCSSSEFTDVAFHPDGTRILTGSFSGYAQIWDIRPTAPIDDPIRIAMELSRDEPPKAHISSDGRFLMVASESAKPRCFDVETGQPVAQVPPGVTTSDPSSADPTGQRAFQPIKPGDEESTRHLVDIKSGQPIVPSVILGSEDRAKFSLDGKRLLLLRGSDTPYLIIRDATTGALLREPISGVSNAWLNPEADRVLMFTSNGLRVMDIATGKDLIDLLPYSHVAAAALTSDGLVAVGREESGLVIHRFAFSLETAPPLLADLAEAIGQHTLTSGVPEPHTVTLSQLQALAAKLEEKNSPPVFSAWVKWFCAPRETRPIAPESKTSMAAHLQRCLDLATKQSLLEATLYAIGNKELQRKIAAQKAKDD